MKKFLKQLDWPLILILATAIFFRLFLLDLRLPHHDEGINGWFSDQITANGFYRYDPTNYHGPLHFYILFLFQTLFGHNLWVLRIPTVIFSILSVFWITLFSPFFGRTTCLIAAFCLAISPAQIYFGRFAIHEADLVFFTILILWGIIGLYQDTSKKYLWALGLGIAGAILTKETYIIHLGCFLIAWVCLIVLEKVFLSIDHKGTPQRAVTLHDVFIVTIVCIFLIVFFYSGAFLNFNWLLGLVQAIGNWFNTGVIQGGHNKPFFYWIGLFFRYEQIALLGLIFSLRYLFPSLRWIRYIAIYGVGVFLAYSLISYKTPWCIVNLLWPFYFVFGDVVASLLKTGKGTPWCALTLVVCFLNFIVSLYFAVKVNFVDYINPKMPYVYVHTLNDIKKLTNPIFKLVRKDPSNYNLIGNIVRSDEWPLPWIFTDFTKIGYYNSPSKRPTKFDADFLLVENGRISEVEKELKGNYFTGFLQMRDAQDKSKFYFSSEKFKDVFIGESPDFIGVK